MRKVILFVLVLAFVVSMACPAFATTDVISPGGTAPGSGTGSNTTSNTTNNPKTGDIIMTWLIVLVLSLIALVAVVVIYRKKSSR